MKSVEIRWGWMLVSLSGLVLFLLRNHKWALISYSGAVVVGALGFAILGPRRAASAERRFKRDALTRLQAADHAGLQALARRQWWLRRFGRGWLIDDALGLSALTQGDATAACERFGAALAGAPAADRPRISLNLARAERAAGQLDQAEGRLRALVAHHAAVPGAQAELGRLLLDQGAAEEAAALLRAAAARGRRPDGGALQLDLARALARSGQPGVAAALAAAETAGADPAAVARLASTRASSQSTTTG